MPHNPFESFRNVLFKRFSVSVNPQQLERKKEEISRKVEEGKQDWIPFLLQSQIWIIEDRLRRNEITEQEADKLTDDTEHLHCQAELFLENFGLGIEADYQKGELSFPVFAVNLETLALLDIKIAELEKESRISIQEMNADLRTYFEGVPESDSIVVWILDILKMMDTP